MDEEVSIALATLDELEDKAEEEKTEEVSPEEDVSTPLLLVSV